MYLFEVIRKLKLSEKPEMKKYFLLHAFNPYHVATAFIEGRLLKYHDIFILGVTVLNAEPAS